MSCRLLLLRTVRTDAFRRSSSSNAIDAIGWRKGLSATTFKVNAIHSYHSLCSNFNFNFNSNFNCNNGAKVGSCLDIHHHHHQQHQQQQHHHHHGLAAAAASVVVVPSPSRSFSKSSLSSLTRPLKDAATFHDSPPLFQKVLIANRGEIALRVIRTCRQMGIKTVAIHSTVDAKALHVSLADEAVCVGRAPSLESYLNIDAILDAIKLTGADAVHPGYGFLSENAEFSQKVKQMGVTFVGPSESAMLAMGDKIKSKQIAVEAGVNTIPGFKGVIQDEIQAIKIANDIGYPIMVKASAGGGGKGMRIAYTDDETRDAFRLCASEARNFFKDDRLLIEKYIEHPHHIEIQVLAGKKKNSDEIEILCFPERECSIQRRNQKIIEESPSVILKPETRAEMVRQCKALIRKVGYESAGTVEWLVDEDQNFYFLEMNTRLQVEHPVTEMVTGVDLVEGMLKVAKGEGISKELLESVQAEALQKIGDNNDLNLSEEDLANKIEGEVVPYQGWAMEARIYAEDPLRGFLPSTGPLLRYQEPKGASIRVDSGVQEGHIISSFYDPMISKLIVHSPTRSQTIDKMIAALDRYVIQGVQNNKSFLADVCRHPAFIEGITPTNFIPQQYPDGFHEIRLTLEEKCQFAAFLVMLGGCRREILGQPSNPLEMDYYGDGGEEEHGNLHEIISESQDGIYSDDDDDDDDDDLEGLTMSGKIIDETIVSFGGMFGEKYRVIFYENGGASVSLLDSSTSTVEMTLGELKYNPQNALAEVMVNKTIKTVQIFGENNLGELLVQIHGFSLPVLLMSPEEYKLVQYMKEPKPSDTSDKLLSPMPGALVSYTVKEGDKVSVGQELCIVEAMKMQNILRSTRTGVVKKLHASVGASLRNDELIMEFENI